KAWGSAGIRLGMAYASPDIISIFTKIKYPYNVNVLTQQQGIALLRGKYNEIERWIRTLKEEKAGLMKAFAGLPFVEKVYLSDANFFLARMKDAVKTYDYLVNRGIIVRNRHNISLCSNCLRITVGTKEENDCLIEALKSSCME
ncbi:Histidinol-phosphate aminotransferase, partial [termite gut metagenome]